MGQEKDTRTGLRNHKLPHLHIHSLQVSQQQEGTQNPCPKTRMVTGLGNLLYNHYIYQCHRLDRGRGEAGTYIPQVDRTLLHRHSHVGAARGSESKG